jgi:uncharacterized RDD family membrane protein YckC
VTLSSAGKRLIAHLLDDVLAIATCGIGWLVWACFTFGNGQTPAKQLMGMRTVNLQTGVRAGWGRMFVREILAKSLVGFLLGWLILPYFWLLWDRDKQQLWDKLVDTTVVDDPQHQVGSEPGPPSPRYLQQPRQYQLPPTEQPTPWAEPPPSGYGQQGGYGHPQYPPPPGPPPR